MEEEMDVGGLCISPGFVFHSSSWFLIALVLATMPVRAEEPPIIPVGLDAYRQWERWAVQRIGARGYMRSTYDRRGGNDTADASHFLYQLADDDNVTLDLAEPGVLYFARYNHWHGSPWRYVVDGAEHVVKETSTADPNKPVEGSVFEPNDAFPAGLTYTWSTTKGADLSWVPIGFERSFRMGYSRTCYGTGYYIFHRYVGGAKLSRPIETWTPKAVEAKDVLELMGRAGQAPADLAGKGESRGMRGVLQENSTTVLADLRDGPGVLRSLALSVPRPQAAGLEKCRLRITWDGRQEPSVDAPVPLFFGAGTLYNRDGREWLVKALPVSIRFTDRTIELACYFPMPFFRSAKVELVNPGPVIPEVTCMVATAALTDPPNHVGYFHATYKDHGPNPTRGADLVLLDTRETEGGGDWTGSFVGTSFVFTKTNTLTTLEGDPRFYFDDSMSPQAQGTGTEEWGGGGDYWGGRNMTLPLAGHPVGARTAKEAKDEQDKIHSAYRFLLADLFPFGKNARITLEHGGGNESKEHYETVTYWYGLPGASVVKSDSLQVGDAASETAHGYSSPGASGPVGISSRYEWGVDHIDGREAYPEHRDVGRTTTGMSQFTLKLDPQNLGVMLRRKLDYQYPNQRAEVFVADASDPAKPPREEDFKPAGVWYLAGSNTCVHSRPAKELDPPLHNVQTSNRRFRDDEFLVSRELTAGRSAIAVRVRFTPVKIELFPGRAFPVDPAWSEIRYDAYCFVMPKFEVK